MGGTMDEEEEGDLPELKRRRVEGMTIIDAPRITVVLQNAFS